MKHTRIQKLTLAGLFCAIAVVGSMFSFPMFGSKCAPIQHMINVLCAVLLGPYYGIGVAFAASLIRNLTGLGSLMAFPGSMVGALLCGLAYHKTRSLPLTLLAEVFGTAVLGGLCAYPVSILLMGNSAGRDRLLRLHRPLPGLHCGGIGDLGRAGLRAAEHRRPGPDAAQAVAVRAGLCWELFCRPCGRPIP